MSIRTLVGIFGALAILIGMTLCAYDNYNNGEVVTSMQYVYLGIAGGGFVIMVYGLRKKL